MIAGLTTEARICGLKAWIVRALKMQTSISGRDCRQVESGGAGEGRNSLSVDELT